MKKLGHDDVVGYDLRADRRREVQEQYKAKTVDNLNDLILSESDAVIISTPPDEHNQYIRLAIENKKPAFVEASIILEGLEELNNLARSQKTLVAPSCTMRFRPAIRDIKNTARGGQYGKITNFSYHCGQYLPDWHPWENARDFYAGKKRTGGCREIVPFELTWIVDIVGLPRNVVGFYGKTMDVGADIDDTYVISMDFGNAYGNMTVDVASRYAIRSLILNMEHGQISWRWDENVVKLYDAINQKWIYYPSPEGQTVEGYNNNTAEDMYVEEIRSFIEAVDGKSKFPNSLDDDIEILRLLQKIEAR